MEAYSDTAHKKPCNTGKIVGQKAPLRLKDIWAIRIHAFCDNPRYQLSRASSTN
jgi:hypothetical protein